MSSEVAVITKEPDYFDVAEMVQTIKETVCKGATDPQFRLFREVCRASGLNPFLKEIWFVPGVGVMAGRDGYLAVANRHPMFDGMETLVERDAQGIPIKATCKVWRKDRSHPITCEAYYNEYKKASSVWATYKSAMIGKVAEVLALKRSFSINGIVTEEEIGEQNGHGSREAQKEAAAEIITRQMAEIAAAKTVAQEVTVPARKSTDFKMLKGFGDMKGLLGDEDYYRILRSYGFEHANDILDEATGKKVYKAMRGWLNVSEPWTRIENRDKARFHALLAGEGCISIADALTKPDAAEILTRLGLQMSVPQGPREKLKQLEANDPEAFWRIVGGGYGHDAEALDTMSVQGLDKLLATVQAELELGV